MKRPFFGPLLVLVFFVTTALLIPSPPLKAAGIALQYRTGDSIATDNAIRPQFNLVNTNATAVPLSSLTIRYWFTSDGAVPQTVWCDWAVVGCPTLHTTVVALPSATSTANAYLEVGFTSGTLNANQESGAIQMRITKADWTPYNEANDYSFDPTKTAFAAWTKVTLYQHGVLIAGSEPTGGAAPTATDVIAPPTATLPPTATPSPTATSTPTSSCATPSWSLAAVYVLNTLVSHSGHLWRAKWWTQGEEPGTTGQWGVWEDRGPCAPPAPHLVVGATSVSVAEGGTARVSVKLSAAPSANVLVAITKVSGDADLTGSASFTVTPINWNVGQVLTLSAAEDADQLHGTAVFAATATGMATVQLTATEIDNDAPPSSAKTIIGYFTAWGFYQEPKHYVKDLETSGSAARLNIINYGFINVKDNRCVVGVTLRGVGDMFADYGMRIDSSLSVDGVGDINGQPLRGHWNQLKKLKARHPSLKVVASLGGWTWSSQFSTAALPENRVAFVRSCIDTLIKGDLPLVSDPNAIYDGSGSAGGAGSGAGVFDGIDIDWEYPATCGLTCDSRPEDTQNFTALLQEFRTQLNAVSQQTGKPYLLTAALPAGEDKFSKLQLAQVGQLLDFVNLMTYDFHGAWDDSTHFLAPQRLDANDPLPAGSLQKTYFIEYAVDSYLSAGVPARKLIVGVPFYGRGWAGVPPGPNGDGLYQRSSFTDPALREALPIVPAKHGTERGMEFFRFLEPTPPGYTKYRNTTTNEVWIYNPSSQTFWSYDDPASLTAKMAYIKQKNLGGAMAWELQADTPQADLLTAVANGLR